MGKLNVLIVENSLEDRDLLQSLVVKTGNGCDTAESGEIAIEKLIEGSYDLIFINLNMPEMSGDATTRHIRKNLSFPQNRIKIIAITDYNYREFFNEYRDVGFNDIVNKPFTPRKIADIINYQNIISVY